MKSLQLIRGGGGGTLVAVSHASSLNHILPKAANATVDFRSVGRCRRIFEFSYYGFYILRYKNGTVVMIVLLSFRAQQFKSWFSYRGCEHP